MTRRARRVARMHRGRCRDESSRAFVGPFLTCQSIAGKQPCVACRGGRRARAQGVGAATSTMIARRHRACRCARRRRAEVEQTSTAEARASPTPDATPARKNCSFARRPTDAPRTARGGGRGKELDTGDPRIQRESTNRAQDPHGDLPQPAVGEAAPALPRPPARPPGRPLLRVILRERLRLPSTPSASQTSAAGRRGFLRRSSRARAAPTRKPPERRAVGASHGTPSSAPAGTRQRPRAVPARRAHCLIGHADAQAVATGVGAPRRLDLMQGAATTNRASRRR